jgi:hypothetical protein
VYDQGVRVTLIRKKTNSKTTLKKRIPAGKYTCESYCSPEGIVSLKKPLSNRKE